MAAVSGPTSHPAPDQHHTQSCSRNSEPSAGQQEHHINLDSASQSHPQQHHLPPRPFYYVQAPPPPPFLPYQWPVSFPYNPFMSFPGMGYSMVMPPFMPPPYIDAPAYIMPHPHMQPVDYRRFFQPPPHAHMAPHQNPYQTRRVRPQQPVPGRETVNSEVQTEPTQRDMAGYNGSPLIGSDSGQGTASSSPSSSSSHKRLTEVADLTLPNSNPSDAIEVRRKWMDVRANVLQSNIKPSLGMQMGQFGSANKKDGHFNVWSVSSTESINPVCNSSQREDVTGKERRLSVPDILMSWGGGPPQAETRDAVDKVMPENEHQLPHYETEGEREKYADSNLAETRDDCILAQASSTQGHEDQLTLNVSETQAQKLASTEKNVLMKTSFCIEEGNQDEFDINPQEDTMETLSFVPFSSYQTKPKMNESVWSVESLAPFVPSQEWMLQNSMWEMLKVTEESEINYEVSPKNPHGESLSESPISSTPPKVMHQKNVPNIDAVSNMTEDVQDHPEDSFNGLSPAYFLPKTNTDENGSSEPEATKIPNQKCTILNEQMADTLEAKMSPGHCNHSDPLEVAEPRKPQEQLLLNVPTFDQHNISPSKRHLVDCGVQCTELHFCPCQEIMGLHGRHIKHKVVRGDDSKAEGVCMNGNGQKHPKRHSQWKNRRQEKNGHQQEIGYFRKVKSRGGAGKSSFY